MKTQGTLSAAILSFALAILSSSFPALAASEASGAGNGGDPNSLEFVAVGRQIHTLLLSWPKTALPEVAAGDLNLIIDQSEVQTTDKPLFEKDQPVAAKNFPKKKLILVNISAWQGLSGSIDKRMALVLHEYLGLLGIEVNSYTVSSKFMNILVQTALEDANRRWSCTAACGGYKDGQPDGYFFELVGGGGPTAADALADARYRCRYTLFSSAIGGVLQPATVVNSCVRN